MQLRYVLIFFFISCSLPDSAQQTLSEIKYKAWNIHALRYYPFTQPADSFMMRVIEQKPVPAEDSSVVLCEKTAADLTMNKRFLADAINLTTASRNTLLKKASYPYMNWLNYARPVREDSPDLNLSLFLSQSHSNAQSSVQSVLELVGTDNIRNGLEQWLGDFDVFEERSKVLFLSVKSPLAKDAQKTYLYFFSSRTEINDIPVYEIVFFSRKFDEKALEGYLYIAVSDLSLVKAIMTLNPRVKKAPAKSILFIQTPSQKNTLLMIGDELSAGVLIEKVSVRKAQSTDSIPSDFLSPSQREIDGLVEESEHTHAYTNLQNGLSFIFTDHIGIFRNTFNLGPVTQMLSYNYMEGLRLRVGGFTSEKVSKRAAIGGYLAFGTKDMWWKYRGDIILTPRLTNRFQFTYVNDLNIPGQDCLDDRRDRIFYSLYQFHTANMSLQKIGRFRYETDLFHGVSLKLQAKYLYDQPVGIVKYETANNDALTTIHDLTTSELGVAVRFAPNEKYLWIKGKRIVLHSPDVDLKVNHRIGVKGILGADYNYHITEASLSKSFDFPMNRGSFDLRFSGGKVWDRVPFPLLFIPSGNQSYVFNADGYNLMRFYEFTTDRFVAGNADVHFNWTPIQLFFHKSQLKMHAGMNALYGPLSDGNNPQLHPELFMFNHGVEALGEKPYTEAHIGLSGILKYLRLDYVYRLTYGHRGSLFLSTGFSL